MTTLRNPADDWHEFKKLWDAVNQLRADVNGQLAARGTYTQDATVTTFTGGSSTCTVTFASGSTATLPYLASYTPTTSSPNNAVTVLVSPFRSIVLGRRGP